LEYRLGGADAPGGNPRCPLRRMRNHHGRQVAFGIRLCGLKCQSVVGTGARLSARKQVNYRVGCPTEADLGSTSIAAGRADRLHSQGVVGYKPTSGGRPANATAPSPS
jgi:hypothetical protein